MLSSMDDYLIHQTANPIRYVDSGDRNFYDRYYFNAHSCSEDFFMVFGLGHYPNLATRDAFAALRVGDQQVVMRTSDALGDRGDSTCGPMQVEVLEGLKTLRVTIAPNPSGIEAELLYRGVHVPTLEPRQESYRHGRKVLDVMRFSQTCTVEGWLSAPGYSFRSNGADWAGYRDRSWGIRPVGESEPAGIIGHNDWGSVGASQDFVWLHVPAQFSDHTLMLKLHQADDGTRFLHEARRVWHDPSRPVEDLGEIELTFHFGQSRREVAGATITCAGGEGGPLTVEIEQMVALFLYGGTGYDRGHGVNDWSHGVWRGGSVTDAVSFDVNNSLLAQGSIDALARFRVGENVGYGLFEYGIIGRSAKYGLSGPGAWNAIVSDGKGSGE